MTADDADRVPELVPIRYGRMLVSPFTFYRGAGVVAADLAATPVSGFQAQTCGDAHLSNFGFFASAKRALVFDINDFDETLSGPWEWDIKRLAASLAVASRQNGHTAKQSRRAVISAKGRSRRSRPARLGQCARPPHRGVWGSPPGKWSGPDVAPCEPLAYLR
jgi:hypothetical protein